jgi:predicted RND superfamily exporter protein
VALLARVLLWLSTWAWRRPAWAALGVVVWLAASGVMLLGLRLDPSLEGLLGHDAPANVAYEGIKERFGHDETIVIAVEADDVLAVPVLRRLDALVGELRREVAGAEVVQSLLDAPVAWWEGDRVRVSAALSPWPVESAVPERVERLVASRAWTGLLFDEAGTLATVVVRVRVPEGEILVPPDVAREVSTAVRAVVDRHRGPGWALTVSGKVALGDALGRTLARDIGLFVVSAVIASAVLLWLRFRRWTGVVLPLLVMTPPVVGTLGLMGALGVPLQLPSAVLPPLVIVISVAGTVHVLAEVERRTQAGESDAVMGALRSKVEPLSIAALTTAVGMLSFATSQIGPARVVGWFGTLAAVLGLVSTLVVVPMFLRWAPWEAGAARGPDVGMEWVTPWVLRGWLTLPAAVLVLVGTAWASAGLRFAHDPLLWLPEAWEERRGTELFDRRLGATVNLEIDVDTGRADGAFDPEWVERVAALGRRIATEPGVGKVQTVVDLLADVSLTLDGTEPPYIGEEGARRLKRHLRLLQLAVPDVAATLVTPDRRHLRIMVRMPATDASVYEALVARVAVLAPQELGATTSWSMGGHAALFAATLAELRASAAVSYPLVIAATAVWMVVAARSVGLGLLLMLPNLLPLTVGLAGLRAVGLPLDIFTLLTLSLALGIVVDDTLHLVAGFRQQAEAGMAPEAAATATVREVGSAAVLTTVLLVAGWSTLLLSEIRGVVMFAAVSSAVLAVGLVADLVVTPALWVAWFRWRPSRSP